MGKSVLKFEELTTLFCQIETVLNSPPISVMSDDPNEVEPLTPAHLSIGHRVDVLPSFLLDQTHDVDNCSPPKQQIQIIMLHFGNRWTKEYVTTLQERSKWRRETSNLKVGDLDSITDDKSAPLQWPIGRMHFVYSGADSAVRVVKVKTPTGIHNRPVQKLIKLPFDTSPPQSLMKHPVISCL